MSWSYVATSSGATATTPFSPTYPAGVQEGDVVAFCAIFAPDTGTQSISASSPGWVQQSAGGGGGARFMWARYSAALALPAITLVGSPTCTWYMVAFRSTAPTAFGPQYGQDGTPPAATDIKTVGSDTLLVLFGSAIGDQAASWSGSAGFTSLVSTNGNGQGDANFANFWIGWRDVATPTDITGIRTTLISNRYYLLVVGGQAASIPFFSD